MDRHTGKPGLHLGEMQNLTPLKTSGHCQPTDMRRGRRSGCCSPAVVTVPLLLFCPKVRPDQAVTEGDHERAVCVVHEPNCGEFHHQPAAAGKALCNAGISLILFLSGLFKHEARGERLADPAVILSVEMA